MNKWWWLLLVTLCWAGAGFTIFGVPGDQNCGDTSPPAKTGRIVSMAPNLTEILFALGLDKKVVAVSNDSDYPPEAADRKKVGTFWQPNIEAVIAAKPDLLVTLGFSQQKNLANRLKRIGYNTLTLNIEKVGELFEAIEKIGEATGKRLQAKALITDMRKKIDNLSALLTTGDRVRVLYVVQREPLRVAGRDTFINEIIELAGGESAIGPTVHKYPPIGTEQVIACGAEAIIESAVGTGDIGRQQRAAHDFWSKWPSLLAVENNRIYVIEADAVLRLGPRLPQAVEMIARCLHPDTLIQNHNEAQKAR